MPEQDLWGNVGIAGKYEFTPGAALFDPKKPALVPGSALETPVDPMQARNFSSATPQMPAPTHEDGVDLSLYEPSAVEASGVSGIVKGSKIPSFLQGARALPGAGIQVATTPISTGGKLYGIYESEMMKQRIYAQQAEDLLKSGSMDPIKRDAILSNAHYIIDNPEYTPSEEEKWVLLQGLANYKETAASRESIARENRLAAEEYVKHAVDKTDTVFNVDKNDAFVKGVKWAAGVAGGITEAAMVNTATGGTGLLPFMVLDSRAQAFRHAIDDLHLDPEAASNVADARGLVTGLVLGVGGKLPGGVGKAFSSEVQESFAKDIAVKAAKGALMAAEQQGLDLTVDKILTGSNDWDRLDGTTKDKLLKMSKQYLTEAITLGLGYEIGGNIMGLKRNARVRTMAERAKSAEYGEGPAGLAAALRDNAKNNQLLSVRERNEMLREAHVADELAKIGFKYVPPTQRDAAAPAPSTARSVDTPANDMPVQKFRDGATLLEGLNKAEQEAMADIGDIAIPEVLEKRHITGELAKTAGLSADERKDLSLFLQKMQDPRYATSPEGVSKAEAIKPVYDKAMEAYTKLAEVRRENVRSQAVNEFMSDLHEEERTNLSDYLKSLQTAEGKPTVVEEPAPPLSEAERAVLPQAHAELSERRRIVSATLEQSDALKEAVNKRMEDEAKASGEGVKFDAKKHEKAQGRLNELKQTGMTNENAMAMLSSAEREQIRLGKRAEDIKAEELSRMRADMHENEVKAVAEKHAPGSASMLKALREAQDTVAPIAEPMADVAAPVVERAQPKHGGRMISLTPVETLRILEANSKSVEALSMRELPAEAKAAAKKHGVSSVKTLRALKLMLDTHSKWDKVNVDKVDDARREKVAEAYRSMEAVIRGMGLSKSDMERVNSAYHDAIFAGRIKGVSVLDAAISVLRQAKLDRENGVSAEAAEINMHSAVSSNKKVADIVAYAHEIGLSTETALEAIIQATEYAKRDRLEPEKTGNKLTDIINAGIAGREAGGELYTQRELSQARAFPTIVKQILSELVPKSEIEEASAPRPDAFDTTTASGKVQALGYVAARAFIREQRSKFMSMIAKKGNDIVDVRKAWSRETVLPWINKIIADQKRGSIAPKNDAGKKGNAKDRSWLLTPNDFTAITKALVDDGFLRQEHGRYVITRMADSAETVLGIKPELVEKAWKLLPHNEDPRMAKIPTIQEEIDALYKDLTPEQMLVLKMYHGIDTFSGSYMNIKQIARAIPGKSDGWVKEQLNYANGVIASRFPNFSLLADKYASEIARYLTPGDLYEDEYTTNFRNQKLADIKDALAFIAQMPGANNAYTKRGTDLNQLSAVGEGTLINKGFFPALRQKIVDAGAPERLVYERDLLEKRFNEIKEEYLPLASKPENWQTNEDRARIVELKPVFEAAREGYLAAIGKVNSSISPETRAMLDFVKDAYDSKRIGMGEDAVRSRKSGALGPINRREAGAVSSAHRDAVATRRRAFSLANAIGDQVATVLESYGFPRELTMDNLRETVIADAMRAYIDNPNSPNKSAFSAALMAIENNDHAQLISTDIVANEVVDAIRDGLGMSDRTAEYRQALEVKQLAINNFEVDIAEARAAHAKTIEPYKEAGRRLDFQRSAVSLYRASMIRTSAEIAKNLFAMRIADPGFEGVIPSIRLVNDTISMIEDLPLTLGHTIEGLPELVANMKSLATGDVDTQGESARNISSIAPKVIKSIEDVSKVLAESATNKRFSEEERQLAASFQKQLGSTMVFINAMGDDAVAALNRYKDVRIKSKADANAAKIGGGAPLPATKTFKALSSMIESYNEDGLLLAKAEKRREAADRDLKNATRAMNAAQKNVDSLMFRFRELQKSIDTIIKSPLPADEAELRELLGDAGMRQGGYEYGSDERIGAEDFGSLTESDDNVIKDAGYEMGKGSILAQEMKASGIRLKPETLSKIANNIIKAASIKPEERGGRTLNELIADQIDNLASELDRKGINLEDSAKMQIGMGAVAELAAHPEYVKLLTDKNMDREELIASMTEALAKLDPKREAETNLMMATHAAENITGSRIESSVIDAQGIKAMAESKASAVAAELAREKEKQNLREGGSATPDAVALAIEDAKTGDAAAKKKAIELAERMWRENPGTPEAYELRQKAYDVAGETRKAGTGIGGGIKKSYSKAGIHRAMELGSAIMLAHYSPEGAALALGAGTAYVAYKLGMKRSAKFAEVMERVKAFPRNTVSEIAAKIKGVAKGISDFTARLMAAVFKDTNGRGPDPVKPTRTDERTTVNRYIPSEPVRDNRGYMTPNGKMRITEASEVYSDPRTLLRKYASTPGSMGGRVFSFDVVRSEVVHPGGGVFSWLQDVPGVGAAFQRVIEANLRNTARRGGNQAIVLGGNGAGKTSFMALKEAHATYAMLNEMSGASMRHLEQLVDQSNRIGVPTDMVYVLRNLGDMIDGAIKRGAEEQRLGYSEGFAETLVNSMKNTLEMAKSDKFKGQLLVVDDSIGRQYQGEAAIKRLESLVGTLDEGYIANRYRESAAKFLLENGHDLPEAVAEWLSADSRGVRELQALIRRVTEEGDLSPSAGSGGVPSGEGRDLESIAQAPEVAERGSVVLITSQKITPLDLAKPYVEDNAGLVEAGSSVDGGIKYLNAGLNLDKFVDFANDVMDRAKVNAKERADRSVKNEERAASEGDTKRRDFYAGGKKIAQWVHRMRTDEQTRIMDLMLLKLHDKDSVTGGFQPMLVKYEGLRDSDPEQYRMMGKAITDSSVQERIIKDSELASRYKMSQESIALYKETVASLKGVQKITLAAFDKKLEEDIADIRDDQDALDPSHENYDKRYKDLEERIAEIEDHGEKVRAIINKNPVFISLQRNSEGTRRIDLVDSEGNHIGMTHVNTGSTSKEMTQEQRKLVIDSMLEQHAKRLWNESGRVGSPERIYEKLQEDYAKGRIKAGFYIDQKFIGDGNSKPLLPDDHFNFVRQAGGMVSAETLQNLIEKRGEGVSAEVARSMMRDLMYLSGARDVAGRLDYERRNVAGYSEDVIGALAMHATNAGYMISNLKYATQIRSELNAFRRNAMMRDINEGGKEYREMLNYVVSMNAPSEKATGVVKAMDALKFYSAWKALAMKPSFGITQAFQGSTTTQLHLMAHYDSSYFNKLYGSSWKAANKLVTQMLGLGDTLAKIDPVKLDAVMDQVFTYENFKGIWKSEEEAQKMAPIVKAAMHKVIQGSSLNDVNVGMMLGVDDAAANAIDRSVATTKLQKAGDVTKNVVGYISQKTENMNRIRDIIAYTVACATESRATDAGKQTGKWAEYGYVSITNDNYARLTYSDLRNEVASALKTRYRGQDIPKSKMEEMVNEETINRIVAFAERNSAHSNFNTGRGYGSELVWNPKGNTATSSFFKTAALFRLFPVNILNAWSTDISITRRRLEAEGRTASEVAVGKYKSMAYGAVASMLLGGAFAVPMAGMLMDLLSGIWNMLSGVSGKPPVHDIKKDFVEWTRKNLGRQASRFAAAGIFGLTPMYGIGAQLSAGEGPLSWDTRNSFVENVGEQVLGANVGAVKNIQRGKKRIQRGDYIGGISNIIAPAGLANVVDAYVTDNYAPGRKLMAGTEDFYSYSKNGAQGRTDQLFKALGMTPEKSTKIYEEDSSNYKLKEARKALIQDLQDAFQRGQVTERNFKEVMEWNKLMIEMERKDMMVKPRPSAMRNRMKRELEGEMRINERLGEEE